MVDIQDLINFSRPTNSQLNLDLYSTTGAVTGCPGSVSNVAGAQGNPGNSLYMIGGKKKSTGKYKRMPRRLGRKVYRGGGYSFRDQPQNSDAASFGGGPTGHLAQFDAYTNNGVSNPSNMGAHVNYTPQEMSMAAAKSGYITGGARRSKRRVSKRRRKTRRRGRARHRNTRRNHKRRYRRTTKAGGGIMDYFHDAEEDAKKKTGVFRKMANATVFKDWHKFRHGVGSGICPTTISNYEGVPGTTIKREAGSRRSSGRCRDPPENIQSCYRKSCPSVHSRSRFGLGSSTSVYSLFRCNLPQGHGDG